MDHVARLLIATALFCCSLLAHAAPPIIQETAKLVPSDGSASDRFGRDVDIHGDAAIVGAPLHVVEGVDVGAAYVFERSGSGAWQQVAKLLPDDIAGCAGFGESVAIQDNLAIVGQFRTGDLPPCNFTSGAIYVFEKTSGGWVQTAKIPRPQDTDLFAEQVAIDGNIIAGSARQGAYLFRRDATGAWTQIAMIHAEDGAIDDEYGGPQFDLFFSTAAIGRTGDFGSYGVVDIYEADADGNWQLASSTVTEVGHGPYGNPYVAIDGNYTVAEKLVFERDATGAWTQAAELIPSSVPEGFPGAVAVDASGIAVLSANRPFPGITSSAVYSFRRSAAGVWGEDATLVASDGSSFAGILAIDGSRVIAANTVGGPIAAYIFELSGDSSPPLVTHLQASPTTVSIGGTATLNATADDSSTGSAIVKSIEYSVAGASWQLMTAVDGAFDGIAESASASAGPFTNAGNIEICVRATDAAGNVSEPACTGLEVRAAPVAVLAQGGYISPAGSCRYLALCRRLQPNAQLLIATTQDAASMEVHGLLALWLGGFSFRALHFDTLSHTDSSLTFTGIGSINGQGSYRFLLSLSDIAQGGFAQRHGMRLKIWDAGNGVVYYDTQRGGADDAPPGTALRGLIWVSQLR